MKKAVERTYLKVLKKTITIGIFGDYDVDGASSTALLKIYFNYDKMQSSNIYTR